MVSKIVKCWRLLSESLNVADFEVLWQLDESLMTYCKVREKASWQSHTASKELHCFVWVSAKFGTCTVVSVKGTIVEAKMCTFTLESTHFIFNKSPIYTHDGASAKFSTNSQKTDYSVVSDEWRPVKYTIGRLMEASVPTLCWAGNSLMKAKLQQIKRAGWQSSDRLWRGSDIWMTVEWKLVKCFWRLDASQEGR
jgi:hypothetical protein